MRHLLLLFYVLIWASVSVADICSDFPGYSKYGTSCFKLYSIPKRWAAAEKSCVAHGGHLASIHSKKEQAFIADLVAGSSNIWIGITRNPPNKAWSDNTNIDYEAWYLESSNAATCGRMRKWRSYEWADNDCKDLNDYICRAEGAVSVSKTTVKSRPVKKAAPPLTTPPPAVPAETLAVTPAGSPTPPPAVPAETLAVTPAGSPTPLAEEAVSVSKAPVKSGPVSKGAAPLTTPPPAVPAQTLAVTPAGSPTPLAVTVKERKGAGEPMDAIIVPFSRETVRSSSGCAQSCVSFTKIPDGVPMDGTAVPSSTQTVESASECAHRCQQDAQCVHFIMSEDGGNYLCETYTTLMRPPTVTPPTDNYQKIV